MAKEDTSTRIEKLSQLIDIPTRNDKGVYEIGPDGYNKMLETIGITPESVKELRAATGDYVAAAHEKFAQAAIEDMVKDASMLEAKAEISLSTFGDAEATVYRSRESNNPKDPATKITTYGANNLSVEILSGSAKSGMNLVRDRIKTLGAEKLKID